MKIVQTFRIMMISAMCCLTVCVVNAQTQTQPYSCVADSFHVFGRYLAGVSMKDYEILAEGTQEKYTCKVSLGWLGIKQLGGLPFYLLQLDIRPHKGLEFITKKPSYRALVTYAENGIGAYDLGAAHTELYPEGVRLQYLVGEEMGCLDLLTDKDIVRITFTDSLYHPVEELHFEDFRSGSTLALMQETLKIASDLLPTVDMDGEEAPLLDRVTDDAEYPGGYYAYRRFRRRNMVYPYKAQQFGIEGSVVVSFIVNEDGSLSDFEVVGHADPLLDAEALRVARLMPDWKPAEFYGKKVKSRQCILLNFYR